jgi:hypothetical protein
MTFILIVGKQYDGEKVPAHYRDDCDGLLLTRFMVNGSTKFGPIYAEVGDEPEGGVRNDAHRKELPGRPAPGHPHSDQVAGRGLQINEGATYVGASLRAAYLSRSETSVLRSISLVPRKPVQSEVFDPGLVEWVSCIPFGMRGRPDDMRKIVSQGSGSDCGVDASARCPRDDLE